MPVRGEVRVKDDTTTSALVPDFNESDQETRLLSYELPKSV
jgi:hypothetical protein